MKILKIIGIIIAALIVIIVILGLVAPREYSVERSVVIDAPRELVFNYIKYWRNWQSWSPWAERDTAMVASIGGKDGEVGSVYKWEGDPKITGKGELINTDLKKYAEIAYHMRFIEPFASEADGYVKLATDKGKTNATWGMYGEDKFPWNIMMLFMNMEAMIGKDFDRGLELLKGLCENEYQLISQYTIEEVDFKGAIYASVRGEIHMSEIHNFFGQSIGMIQNAIQLNRAKMTGAPVGLYYTWDEQTMVTQMAAGVPLNKKVRGEGVESIKVQAGKAYKIDYYGPYSGVAPAYNALDLYFAKNNLNVRPPVVEEYITDPYMEPDSTKWLTRIYFITE